MKKTMLCMLATGVLLSCNNAKTDTAGIQDTLNVADTTPAASRNLPYTANYSSRFKFGDPVINDKILTLFKYWDDNKLADAKSLFADSIVFYGDGWEFKGTRDSFMTVSQKERDSYKEVRTVVHAWIPVHSIDKNEDWALVWSTGYTTSTTGKIDSANYQDTWRMNKKGQFDLMNSYKMKSPAPAKK